VSDRKILITGATGFVGGNLLCRLLTLGYDAVLIVRSNKSDQSAGERIKQILSHRFEPSVVDQLFADRITIVEGDVVRSRLGIEKTIYTQLIRELSAVWHCAASLKFDERNRDFVEEHNIAGTNNIIEFVQRSDANIMHHMSTAYVSGNKQGVALEKELSAEYGFKNPYEESKHNAEKLINESIENGELNAAIYRPSIVVGDSKTLHTTNLTGIYAVARALEVISEKLKHRRNATEPARFRILGDPESRLNLVPVDYVVDAAAVIAESKPISGTTYHLVNSRPPSLKTVCEGISDALGIELVPEGRESFTSEPATTQEKILERNVRVYLPYLQDNCEFDVSNTRRVLEVGNMESIAGDSLTLNCPLIDRSFISRLIRHCVSRQWRMI
jgi:thioester reductase-like protein